MAYRKDWIRQIRRRASRYGIDPLAALAVASAEGLSGGVGDAGTSYGPFQLHVGGALPRGRNQAWAESPAGIEYALRTMAQSGARGLKGDAAIRAIVSRFERPADPNSEISRALGMYGKVGGGVTPQGAPTQAPEGPSPDARKQLALALIQQNQGGQQAQFGSILDAVRTLHQPQAAPVAQAGPQAAGAMQSKMPKGIPPVVVGGKVIGYPGQGTHSRTEGPNNWQSDNAWDIRTPVGSAVLAPVDGVIEGPIGSTGQGGRFAGQRLYVRGSDGHRYYLAHLSKIGVKAGQKVRAGQVIGRSGSANGVPHVHVGYE